MLLLHSMNQITCNIKGLLKQQWFLASLDQHTKYFEFHLQLKCFKIIFAINFQVTKFVNEM